MFSRVHEDIGKMIKNKLVEMGNVHADHEKAPLNEETKSSKPVV